jgi:uncharacterized RDD family membrane protein YckC
MAWAVDYWFFGAVALLAAVVLLPVSLTGLKDELGPAATNVLVLAVVLVLETVVFGWLESTARKTTPGKRAVGLRVVDVTSHEPVTFRRGLVRNGVRFGPPLIILDALLYNAPTDLGLVVLIVPTIWVVSLFVGSGRTPYDRLAGTTVIRPPGPEAG